MSTQQKYHLGDMYTHYMLESLWTPDHHIHIFNTREFAVFVNPGGEGFPGELLEVRASNIASRQ